jgi:hypothetical protein
MQIIVNLNYSEKEIAKIHVKAFKLRNCGSSGFKKALKLKMLLDN